MSQTVRFHTTIALFIATSILLVAGVVSPILTIRGTLVVDGLVTIVVDSVAAKEAKGKPVTDAERAPLRESVSGFVKGIIPPDQPKDLYVQTRSILGSVSTLYVQGAFVAATLILIFSIGFPAVKMFLLVQALLNRAHHRGIRIRFIAAIGKWSMADVFVVAIFIAYLAAKATAGTTQAVAFTSAFGSGFYYFASYCIASIACQQIAQPLMQSDCYLPTERVCRVWKILLAVLTGTFVSAGYGMVFPDPTGTLAIAIAIGGPALFYSFIVFSSHALRLKDGPLRMIVTVVFCYMVYRLMVFWAITLSRGGNSMESAVGGIIPGAVGALLTSVGLARVLDARYTWKALFCSMAVCAAGGFVIVQYGVGASVFRPTGTPSAWATLAFHAGHVLWQTSVANLLLGCPGNESAMSNDDCSRHLRVGSFYVIAAVSGIYLYLEMQSKH